MPIDAEKFKQILRQHGVSITSARLAIFATLLTGSGPLRKAEVASLTSSVSRASVYRALELFDQLGIITTSVRGWTPYIELAEPFKPHHHHLQCTLCQQLVSLDSSELEQLIGQIAITQGYQMVSHHIELFGICASCQADSRHSPLTA